MKFLILFIFSTSMLFAQSGSLSTFSSDGQGAKDERIEKMESYLSQISKSYLSLKKKVSSLGKGQFDKLKKRVDKIEKDSSGGCCSLVDKSNLPKLTEDIKYAKKKVLDIENTVNSIRTTDLAKIKAEMQVMNATLDSLKILIKSNMKLKENQ
ncbi:MAG: hypothetical protein KC493_10145 [Bacteriovoracaceae bacterium]|nr:hypothetical protein [Bacteriovoracaceae bacterium]